MRGLAEAGECLWVSACTVFAATDQCGGPFALLVALSFTMYFFAAGCFAITIHLRRFRRHRFRDSCSATIKVDAVLPHPGMLPSGSSIASPECSRRRVSLSIDNEVWPPESLAGSSWMPRCGLSRLSCSFDKPAFPSRPGAPNPRRAAEGIGRSGATRSHAQRALAREHGEDGEHQTFPDASTVVRFRRVEN
jgi:hypothetical protein